MEVSYSSLHRKNYSEEFLKDTKYYVAEISHLGIRQLRATKNILYSKRIKELDTISLDKKVDEQFEKWDKKWKGQFPGPNCTYDANTPHSPTGFTWRQLEKHRNKMRTDALAIKGITEVTDMMLFTSRIPLYNNFFDIEESSNPIKKMIGLNFVAIDFETANEKSTSACSLGLVKVVNGEIAESFHWLIRPEPFIMNPINEGIHGISLYKLTSAPTFDVLWPQIQPLLENQLIVAHNCSFDLDKLKSLVKHYFLDFNFPETFCTMAAYKSLFPNSSATLSNVANIFGIELDHHEALSDATACANLAVKLARLSDVNNLNDIFLPPVKRTNTQKNENTEVYFRSKKGSGVDVEIDFTVFNPLDPSVWNWTGKKVVVTGVFKNYDRDEIINKLISLGASLTTGISKITDIMLVGHENVGPTKLEKARQYNVRLMSEAEFENLLNY